jgi:hypothetical protein
VNPDRDRHALRTVRDGKLVRARAPRPCVTPERALVMAYLFEQAKRFDEEAAEASVRGLVQAFAKEGVQDEDPDQEEDEDDVDDDGVGDRASALFNAALAVARGDHAAPQKRRRT